MDEPGFSFGFLTSVYLAFLLAQAHQNWDSFWKGLSVVELEKARTMAEADAHSRTALLASVSHEIRTPLNGVVGMLELMLGPDLTAEQRERLSIAHASALQLSSLLDRVLDYSAVQNGALTLDQLPFDLRWTVDITLAPIRTVARQKGLALHYEVDPELPDRFIGDSVRLGQVLANLASNAVKFTRRGEVRVAVKRESANDRSTTVRFSVTDTGIGISEEARSRIFLAYTQGDDTTGQRYGGVGLGLAIVREIVSRMGGQIEVQSAPGRGSDFRVRIPLAHAPTEESRALPARIDGSGSPVLLAEDNVINQMVTTQMLQRLGFEVQIVSDGRQAVAAASLQTFEIILMDCQMPGMDGYEAARAIRREGPNRATPILAISASAMLEDRDRALAAGMNDFLAKPLTGERLTAALQPFAAHKKARSAGTR